MTKTKEVDRADLAFTAGPAPFADVVPGTCQRCGRAELVKTTVPKDAEPVLDTAGDEVKPGAHVTVCALCGAVQTSRTLKDGGRTTTRTAAKATPKRKPVARKAKRSATRKSTARRKSTTKTASARKRRASTRARGR